VPNFSKQYLNQYHYLPLKWPTTTTTINKTMAELILLIFLALMMHISNSIHHQLSNGFSLYQSAHRNTTLLPCLPLDSMPTHFKETKQRQKEDKAMVAHTLQKEKDATGKHNLNVAWEVTTNPPLVKKVVFPSEPPPTVVTPPSTPSLHSLLTGNVGWEGEMLVATKTTTTTMVTKMQAKDTVTPPKKNK
jgi:hypothetical protein